MRLMRVDGASRPRAHAQRTPNKLAAEHDWMRMRTGKKGVKEEVGRDWGGRRKEKFKTERGFKQKGRGTNKGRNDTKTQQD
jgi:hypothetical protein